MLAMRVAVVLLVALSLVTGCGGTDVGAGPATSAELLKPGALVYWQTVSDPDSTQWEQTEDLLEKFPDGDRWIARLKEELRSEGVSWEEDVRPALGSVVEVVVYAGAGTEEPAVVGLTNPDDEDKLLALIDKLNESSDEDVISRSVGDWVAVSDRADSIDAALKQEGAETLADDESFSSALEELPADALSRVYVDPARAIYLAGQGVQGEALSMLGLEDLDFAAAWAKAKDDGAELAATLRGDGADRLLGTGEPYVSKLLDHVPADAFAFFTFRGEGVQGQVQRLRDNPLFAAGLGEFEAETGIDVDEVASVLDGEIALYVRPGIPIPEFTLLLDSADAAADRESVEQILRTAAGRLGGMVTEEGDVTTVRFEDFRVVLGTTEGAVVLSTSANVFARSATDGLAESDRYQAALESAGAPDQYTGLAYVDVREVSELLRSYLGFADESDELPPQVSRNLERLESLVAYGTEDGTLSKVVAFLEID
jgi:Protein of unknown function (DUF3352)